VVNPASYGLQGQNSSEGQAFMVEMQSAWRDWMNAKSRHGGACSIKLSPKVLWAWAGVNTLMMVGLTLI
jgi:predicted alpha/beta hydrolase